MSEKVTEVTSYSSPRTWSEVRHDSDGVICKEDTKYLAKLCKEQRLMGGVEQVDDLVKAEVKHSLL